MTTMRRMLGLRLSLWYATVFIVSTIALAGLSYALLASSLAQRDHDIIYATLREYASRYELGGLPALQRAVELEQRTGDQERLFVRVLGSGAEAVFTNMTTLGGFDITRNNMPFPSNRMNATTAGVSFKCNPRALPGLSVLAGAGYVVNGRNVGQATMFNGGLFYVFDFGKKAKTSK